MQSQAALQQEKVILLEQSQQQERQLHEQKQMLGRLEAQRINNEQRLVEQQQAFTEQHQLQQQLHSEALHLLQDQIKQLKQDHQRSLQQLHHLHEQQINDREAQRASLQHKLTLAEQQCQQQADTAQHTIQALNNQLEKEQQQHKSLLLTAETDNKAFQQALNENMKQVAELQGEARQLRLLAEERKCELSDSHAELFQLKHDVTQLEAKLKGLLKKNAVFEDNAFS